MTITSDPTAVDTRPGGVREHLVPLTALAAMTVALFWPVIRHFNTRVIYAGGDGANVMWAWSHVSNDLVHLRNPFVTADIFYPVGTNLAFHTMSPLVIVLLLPVIRLFGPALAVNLVQVTSAFLAGVGMYFLALRVAGDRRAAFVAGVAFAFVPYRFVHAGNHYTLIHTELLPFAALGLLRLADRPTRWRGVALGSVVGAAYLIDQYLFVFVLFVLIVLATSWRHRLPPLARLRGPVTWAALTALLLALPLAIAQGSALASGELSTLPAWGGANVYSVDLLGWLLPPPSHPLWGQLGGGVGGYGEPYMGYAIVALALFGRELGDTVRRRGWVALAATSAVLAMGPFLRVANRTGSLFSLRGTNFTVPLPYLAWAYIPLLNGIRAPMRFVIVTALALSILMAVSLSTLFRLRPRLAPFVAAAAFLIIVVEFLPGSIPVMSTRVPAPYGVIGKQPDRRAVLDLPLQWATGSRIVGDQADDETVFMYDAVTHHHPMSGGSVARLPDGRLRRLEGIPVYRQIAAAEGDPRFTDRLTFTEQDLSQMGIGYVVYHRDRPRPALLAHLGDLRLQVLADDGTVVVWTVHPSTS